MSTDSGLWRDYGDVTLDEAIDPTGEVRSAYTAVLPELAAVDLAEATDRLEAGRREAGVVFIAPVDGEPVAQVFPLDPVPRIIGAGTWAHLSAGAAQRARALNAFLADVYGDDGRPAGEPPQIVADGIIPDRVVRDAPGYRRTAPRPGPERPAEGCRRRPRSADRRAGPLGRAGGQPAGAVRDGLRAGQPAVAACRAAVAVRPAAGAPVARGARPVAAFDVRARSRRRPRNAIRRSCCSATARRTRRGSSTARSPPRWASRSYFRDQLEADGDGVAAPLADGRRMPVDVLYRRLGTDELLDGPVADLVQGRSATAG